MCLLYCVNGVFVIRDAKITRSEEHMLQSCILYPIQKAEFFAVDFTIT